MFRLVFTPKDNSNKKKFLTFKKAQRKHEIHVLDKCFEDFNIFKIDVDHRKVIVDIHPNYERGFRNYDEMWTLLKEGWDVYKLKYTIHPNSRRVEFDIPKGYEVTVVLK